MTLWIIENPTFKSVERLALETYPYQMDQGIQKAYENGSVAIFEALNRYGYCSFECLQYATPEKALSFLSDVLNERIFSTWAALTPTAKSDASPVSYSGMFGYGEFPLHSDMANWKMPPRYLVLMAKRGSPSVQTPIVDSAWLVARIGKTELTRALVQPRRPVRGMLPLMRLLEPRASGQSLFRWDQTFIKPVSPAGKSAFDSVVNLLEQAPRFNFCLDKAGSAIVIDNWRMLHGRGAVAKDSKDREVHRAYLGEAA